MYIYKVMCESETERQRDRETERQRDRETQINRDTETYYFFRMTKHFSLKWFTIGDVG